MQLDRFICLRSWCVSVRECNRPCLWTRFMFDKAHHSYRPRYSAWELPWWPERSERSHREQTKAYRRIQRIHRTHGLVVSAFDSTSLRLQFCLIATLEPQRLGGRRKHGEDETIFTTKFMRIRILFLLSNEIWTLSRLLYVLRSPNSENSHRLSWKRNPLSNNK